MGATRITMVGCSGGGGGFTRCVGNLTPELVELGYELTTGLPITPWVEAHGRHLYRDIPQICFDPRVPDRGLPRRKGESRELVRFLRDNPSDLVLIHEPYSRLRLRDMLAVRVACRTPLVVAIHAYVKRTDRMTRTHQKLCGLGVDRVVATTELNRNRLAASGIPSSRIEVVRLGIPAPARQATPDEARKKLGLAPDAFVFGCVTRLEEGKRVPDLIRAFDMISADHPTAQLLVVGDGAEKDRVDEIVRQTQNPNIRLVGFMPDPSWAYAAIDAFVLPSVNEAFGMVYIEAGQFGLPAIGARDGGVPEAVLHGKTGLLIDPRDVAGLATAMLQLKEDSDLRKRLGCAARLRAEQEFSSRTMACGYARIVDCVLAKGIIPAARKAGPPGNH